MKLSLSVFTTEVRRGWDSNTQPSAFGANALTHCISYSVYSNAQTMPVKIYGEPYAQELFAVDIFLEYHPSSSDITPCQVPSRVRTWFHDLAGDIGFLSNVSQPIRINYFSLKYNIIYLMPAP